MRAAVIGAGPAGMLAAHALARAGVEVCLVPRAGAGAPPLPSPAWHHVHVVPAPAWSLLERLVPGLTRQLPGARRPDRAELDGALAGLCLPDIPRVESSGVQAITWGSSGAELAFHAGTRWRSELVIDATGGARITCGSVASHLGGPVPVDVVPGGGRYTSALLRGVRLPDGDGFLAARAATPGSGVLLLALGNGLTRITVQTPADQRIADPRGLKRAWVDVGDPAIHAACAAAVVTGSLVRWGPHPITRIVLEECADAPSAWMPLGDALLVTPPHLARGIAHLAEQVAVLENWLATGRVLPDLRARLADVSAVRWFEATLMDGLVVAG